MWTLREEEPCLNSLHKVGNRIMGSVLAISRKSKTISTASYLTWTSRVTHIFKISAWKKSYNSMRGILGRTGLTKMPGLCTPRLESAFFAEDVDNECNENDYHLSLDDLLPDHNTHVGEQEA
ncbi:hypothetical protein SASPL_154232 [Salvia splendens]|uniref:Uncharacterized protein n=1 Tax=Salvia splendens TaxID=180675 RepID=A0A8X8YZN4_SALSN|nr:hypothetical protein SASPL_154232 [Salvia splendens]